MGRTLFIFSSNYTAEIHKQIQLTGESWTWDGTWGGGCLTEAGASGSFPEPHGAVRMWGISGSPGSCGSKLQPSACKCHLVPLQSMFCGSILSPTPNNHLACSVFQSDLDLILWKTVTFSAKCGNSCSHQVQLSSHHRLPFRDWKEAKFLFCFPSISVRKD